MFTVWTLRGPPTKLCLSPSSKWHCILDCSVRSHQLVKCNININIVEHFFPSPPPPPLNLSPLSVLNVFTIQPESFFLSSWSILWALWGTSGHRYTRARCSWVQCNVVRKLKCVKYNLILARVYIGYHLIQCIIFLLSMCAKIEWALEMNETAPLDGSTCLYAVLDIARDSGTQWADTSTDTSIDSSWYTIDPFIVSLLHPNLNPLSLPLSSGAGCQIAGFITVFASELSIFTLTLITLERLYAITCAIHLDQRLKLSLAIKIMLCGWLYAITVASLPLFGISGYSTTSICLPMAHTQTLDIAYITSLLTINALAFLIICLSYGKVSNFTFSFTTSRYIFVLLFALVFSSPLA